MPYLIGLKFLEMDSVIKAKIFLLKRRIPKVSPEPRLHLWRESSLPPSSITFDVSIYPF